MLRHKLKLLNTEMEGMQQWEIGTERFKKLQNQIDNTSIRFQKASAKVDDLNDRLNELESKNDSISLLNTSIQKLADSFNKVTGRNFRSSLYKIENGFSKINKRICKLKTNILKYAGALFGIRSIYYALRNSANAWLSSQNKGAQQLSANIEYLKYAMGSVFAPVIEYVTNLIYSLLKAVQNLVYAFSGINIFANATASSMKNAVGSAKELNKVLAGFDELNNIHEDKESSGGLIAPNIDLSNLEHVSSSVIDAIKNSNWYIIGETVGEKINEVLSSIAWEDIQTQAENIGTNVADFINGFVKETDWTIVGNSIAQGINTAVSFASSVIEKTDWNNLGQAIGNTIGTAIININWQQIGYTIGLSVKSIKDFFVGIGEGIVDGIFDGMFKEIKEWPLIKFFVKLFVGDFKEKLGIHSPSTVMRDEVGIYVAEGFLQGVMDGFKNIGQWINNNIYIPFVEGFKKLFGIHSPSTVMEGFGQNIVQGLLQGIADFIGNVPDKFKETIDKIKNLFNNLGTFFSNVWNNIKETFSKLGSSISSAISNAVKTGINNIIRLIQNTINKAINMINGAISVINLIPGVNISKLSQLSLPQLEVGTNYVPEDQLAYIHKGEAVIPKKFNSQEYFRNGNEETNGLLERVIEAIENIEINPYTTIKDVGKTAVNYINSKNRQLGGSVIN